MAQPYIGEIRMFAGNFNPVGWAFCNGQLLPIEENEALFQLIGTTYGGDGQSTFGLPNLQSRVPIHMGTNAGTTYQLAEMAGVENVTLTTQQIPSHSHAMMASSAFGTLPNGQNNVLGATTNIDLYSGFNSDTAMSANAVLPAAGSQPHDNMQPFQCINYIISLFGIFPSQN